MDARDALEQAVLVAIGAAALTRERAEAVVASLVTRGQIGADEGTALLTRLLARLRGEGPPSQPGLIGRVEDAAGAAVRELGIANRSDLDDLRMRIAELEHRIGLLEGADPPEPANGALQEP
jgi:polyhydroxyalkanoate synthesis regulator phasin